MGYSSRHRSAPRPNNCPRSRLGTIALTVGALLLAACGRPAVDPALVGVWDLPVQGGTWRLAIDGTGHYQFTAEGGGTAPAHSGDFTAHDGEWAMHAANPLIDDHGRYEIGAGGALKLTGNRGALNWQRGAAPLAATAAHVAPTAAPIAAPAPASTAASAAATSAAALTAKAAPVVSPPSPPPVAKNQASSGTAPSGAASSSSGALPDTIDPCLLVTAAEAGQLIGTTVESQRTTPQPHTQNDCRYHPKGSQRSVGITTYNGGGMDIPKYLANHATGSTALAGVGDGAYLNYHAPTGLTQVNFVIGTATFEILVAGVPRDTAEPALRQLAATAAKRAVSSSSFQVPGLERFVGTWMSRQLGKDGSDVVVWIERDGTIRMQAMDGFSGTMTLAGSSWSVADPSLRMPVTGELTLSGDSLSLRGEYLQAEMTRVPCGKAPSKVKPPYDLTKLLTGHLNGKGLAIFNPKADGTQFDPRLAGLWEGEGATLNGRATQALVSLDDKGRGLFALFPTASGKFTAADGNYKALFGGKGDMAGAYHFSGGINEGLVQLVNGSETYELRPYDPSKRAPYETPIVGHCR
jgi:hypothetical protein